MTWKPTKSFFHGTIIKPFLPYEKHPNLKNEHLKNLYPGDEVYIFEVNGEVWARGYCITKPLPTDFTITSVNLDDIPRQNILVHVFPLKYVNIFEEIPFRSSLSNTGSKGEESGDNINNPLQNGLFDQEDGLVMKSKTHIPVLPINSLGANNLQGEIKYVLQMLVSHIFALYSIGEYRLFSRLSLIYNSLYETRLGLLNDVLTSNEIRIAKENSIQYLNRIPKKLASRAARINTLSYDLDNEDTDLSGYKAILARNPETGEFLSTSNQKASEIANVQVLSSLMSNYPIGIHNNREEFSLAPKRNKCFLHSPPSHVLVDFKSVTGSSAYQPPGFVGMIVYLYIRNSKKRLTEAFAVHTNSVDALADVEKISAALFKNIPSSEIESGRIYMVAVITEEIDLTVSESLSIGHVNNVRKGIAAGVADISRIFSRRVDSLASGVAHEFAIRLFGSYVPKSTKSSDSTDHSGWGELVDRIINGSTHGIAVNPRAEKLVVSIREFRHQIVSETTVSHSTPIASIKPIFFDPLAENYERLYLKLGKIAIKGSFPKDGLLTIQVSAPNNESIRFAKASNQQELRTWQFVSVFSDESIGEIIKVNGISAQTLVSKDDFILLLLYINGTLVAEGKLLYKANNKLVEYTKPHHEVLLLSINDDSLVAKLDATTNYIGKAFMSEPIIEKILLYDQYFKGGKDKVDEISRALKAFLKLDSDPMVKYLSEIKLALCEIIEISVSKSLTSLHDDVFFALVHLIDAVFGKQDHYLYLIESFFVNRANLPNLSVFIIHKVSEALDNAEKIWNSQTRSVCRVFGLLIRLASVTVEKSGVLPFVASMRALFKGSLSFFSIKSVSLFSEQISLLNSIDYIVNLKSYVEDVAVFGITTEIISTIGRRGLGINNDIYSDRPVANAKEHLIQLNKLLMVHRLFNTSFISDEATRFKFLYQCINWCMDVFKGPIDIEATRLACAIMNSVCSFLLDFTGKDGYSDIYDLSRSMPLLLPAIARAILVYYKHTRGNDFFKPKKEFTFIFPNDFPFKQCSVDPIVNGEVLVEVLVELAIIFSMISKIGENFVGSEGVKSILEIKSESIDFSRYLSDEYGKKDIQVVLSAISVLRQGKFFPERKWLSLYAVIVEGCFNVLKSLNSLLISNYIPQMQEAEQFSRSLWGNYLLALLRLSCVTPVSIEHLFEVPHNACDRITHGIREQIAYLFEALWNALAWDATDDSYVRFNLKRHGGYQVEFISTEYSVLRELMLFGLQKSLVCEEVAVRVLWSILVSEFILNDSIVEVEKECLMGLLEIFNRHAYKPSLVEQQRLIGALTGAVRIDVEDIAYSSVFKFVESLDGFLDVLNDLNSVPVGPEFEDDRTHHKLKINAYLKNADKPELFNSFINSMYENNLKKENYVQAALSLKLLADSYSWNHHIVLPASIKPKFPSQTSFERKELLYKLIAKNFVKGNSLEKATDILNELLDSYNEHTYDLKSFANVHSKLANLYLQLESSEKLSPSFFKVSFIGAGFPANIRGREMIYEGLPFEHITSMHERLLMIYRGARIISDDAEAQALYEKAQTGRFLHVCSIEPVNEISDKLFNTSIGVRQYARNKNLRYFTLIKRLPNSKSVFDLWTEETTYETVFNFPILMNRSEIKRKNTVKLSPLDNAIRSVINKNNDLIELESMIHVALKEKADTTSLFNDLSRQLAGTVNSPVNGGVGKYREFFTLEAYAGAEHTDDIRLLKDAFKDLAIILNNCLALHSRLVSQAMRPSHEALVELYQLNFKDEIAELKIDLSVTIPSPSPPVPSYPSLMLTDRNMSSGASTRTASMNGGAKLVRTKSINSSTSGNSGYSDQGMSRFSSSSSTFNSTSERNGPSKKSKRSVLNWKKVINQK